MKPVVKAEAPRKVALKKLDVKSLADELKAPSVSEAPPAVEVPTAKYAAAAAGAAAQRPIGVVKAVPVKPAAKAPAGKDTKPPKD